MSLLYGSLRNLFGIAFRRLPSEYTKPVSVPKFIAQARLTAIHLTAWMVGLVIRCRPCVSCSVSQSVNFESTPLWVLSGKVNIGFAFGVLDFPLRACVHWKFSCGVTISWFISVLLVLFPPIVLLVVSSSVAKSFSNVHLPITNQVIITG